MNPSALILAASLVSGTVNPHARVIPIPLKDLQDQVDGLKNFIEESKEKSVKSIESMLAIQKQELERLNKSAFATADRIKNTEKRIQKLEALLERVKK